MNKGFLNIVIFLMLIFLLNKYADFNALFDFLLLSYSKGNLRSFPPTLLYILTFIFKWLIPGIIVFLLMKNTKLVQRIQKNWGLTIVAIIVGLDVLFSVGQPVIFYLTSLVQGGGLTYGVASIINIFKTYSSVPVGLALFAGTMKIFLTLKPYPQGNRNSI